MPRHKPKPRMVAAPLPEKKWGRTRPDPDCTGDSEKWPWVTATVKSPYKISCATVACTRKPGRLRKTGTHNQVPLCRVCQSRQVKQ